jgi:GT2 family glycosyltransferase
VAADPFDRRAAAALYQVLADAGRHDEAAAFQAERQLLHRAAPDLVPLEDWFALPAVPRPTGRELASIVILCHNQVDYTRGCLESVLQFTRAPYELILVDNASTDATPALLEELRSRPGPARVEVLRNEANLGFGRGCNQGMAASRGAFVVLLNNDTLVTPGWLDGLIALSVHDWPRVGMTGPVSNAATPEQTVETAYRDVGQMLAFARDNARRCAGQAVQRDRLSGFCLLVRRDVLDRVGGFDERFGLGFFEDDDLSLRVRKAGYKLLVAHDVFVHHYGSRTVQALGINAEEQLRTNLGKFVDKWGDDTPAGYRHPAFTPLGTTQRQAEQPRHDQRAGDAVFTSWAGGAEADHDALFAGRTVDVAADVAGLVPVAPTPARVS